MAKATHPLKRAASIKAAAARLASEVELLADVTPTWTTSCHRIYKIACPGWG
jgi:hypothetical protein